MSATIPTIEPTQIRAGDTIKWTKSLADYPASSGWNLKYRLVGNNGAPAVIAASASGDDFTVTIDKTVTASYTVGLYTLQGWVEKGTEQFTIAVVTVEVLPNLAGASGALDTRSHEEKVLAQLETAIEEYPIDSLTVAGRTIQRPSLRTLYAIRSKYKRLVDIQRRKQQGKGPRRAVVRFGNVSS